MSARAFPYLPARQNAATAAMGKEVMDRYVGRDGGLLTFSSSPTFMWLAAALSGLVR